MNHQVNLVKAKDTRIGMGDQKKGISGGEKRRLAFACEVNKIFALYWISIF